MKALLAGLDSAWSLLLDKSEAARPVSGLREDNNQDGAILVCSRV